MTSPQKNFKLESSWIF